MVKKDQGVGDERAMLEKACPPDVKLHYNFTREAYELLYKPRHAKVSKMIGAIPRTQVLMWREPKMTLNHVARHALHKHNLPTRLKVKSGEFVEVHAS